MWRDLASLTKPGVTAQCVVTTAGGMALAGWPDGMRAMSALLGTALVVGSANALNCYLERDTDALMVRTRDRPLATGRLSSRVGLWFGLSLGALALPVLTLGAGVWPGLLGALALVTYVGAYTPLKRHSALALPVGAIPGAVPPLLGFTAATGHVDAAGVALFALLFLWQFPHFIAIALRRHREYAAAGLHTLVGAVGEAQSARLGVAGVWMLVPVSLAPAALGLTGAVYAAGAVVLGLAWGLRASFGSPLDPRWVTRFFGDSLVYLTALVGMIVADAVLV